MAAGASGAATYIGHRIHIGVMEPMLPDPRDLPAELEELGERLEIAAAAQIARRRAWRRALRKGALSVVVGTPLALAIGASELAPSSAPVERIAKSGRVLVTTTARLADRRPDAADSARGWPCVMYPDCRPGSGVPAVPSSARPDLRRQPMATSG
ncbi:MAG: hypothetical protein M3P50_09905 [Actinomycetota bacterium]|nr:hypothetical protein [Actinomycetota bacterium]